MTPPPLPPHERSWRHPSELPAPPHEPPTRTGRVLIVLTGAIGLALVGVMAVRMTPGRTAYRDALVTASTSAVLTSVSAETVGEIAGAASNTGRRFTDLVGRAMSSLVSSVNRTTQISASTVTGFQLTPSRRADADGPVALVTPIGADGLGVTTAAAVNGRAGEIEAMLPSGTPITARLLGTSNGVAVVRLPAATATDAASLGKSAEGDWTVVAYGDEFDVSDGGNGLRSLAVPEAAPIFDANGALVGLCTIGPDGVELLTVSSLPDLSPTAPTEPTSPDSSIASPEPANSVTTVDDESAPTSPDKVPSTAPGSSPMTSEVTSSQPSIASTPEASGVPSTS